MIRILHVVSILDVGGMESYIMNMYRRIDRTKVQFDFLVHHQRPGFFEDEILALGGRIHRTTLMDDFNLPRYIRQLRVLFREHPEYRIIHGHLTSPSVWYLGEAKRAGIPWRIAHAHCPGHIPSLKGAIKHVLFQFAPIHANIRLACSTEAGRYLYRNRSFELIPNGIDVDKFRFSLESRNEIRSGLGLDGCFVIGHVGRFYYEKNHEYILKIFARVHQQLPRARLLLLGEGKLKQEIEAKVREMKLDRAVIFAGLIQNCAPYYHAMDAFIMPSLYEGLPLTGLEAQCAGLPCLFSSTVSTEVQVSQSVDFLPIGEENINLWVSRVLEAEQNPSSRSIDLTRAEPFDCAIGTQKMVERYFTLWETEA